MIDLFGAILTLIFFLGLVLIVLAGAIIALLVCAAPVIVPVMLYHRSKNS